MTRSRRHMMRKRFVFPRSDAKCCKKCRLTALLDGFVAPVRTISELVANFAQLDALSAATLELVGAVARRRCREKELQRSQYFLPSCRFFSTRVNL